MKSSLFFFKQQLRTSPRTSCAKLWSRQILELEDQLPWYQPPFSTQQVPGIVSINPCLPALCHCTFFVYYLLPYLLCPWQLIGFPWLDNHRESDKLTFHVPTQEPQQLTPRVTPEFSSGEQPSRSQQNLLPQVSYFSLVRQSSLIMIKPPWILSKFDPWGQ